MSTLNDAAILAGQAAGTIALSPFEPSQLRGASYVLRLGRRFRRWTRSSVPVALWAPHSAGTALDPPFEAETTVIGPGELLLAATLETVRLSSDFIGQLSPLSHLARFGLGVTGGADFVNPGFGAVTPTALTLELFNYNPNPLELRAGMPLAHLRIERLSEAPVGTRLVSIYEGADPVAAPQLYEEWVELMGLAAP